MDSAAPALLRIISIHKIATIAKYYVVFIGFCGLNPLCVIVSCSFIAISQDRMSLLGRRSLLTKSCTVGKAHKACNSNFFAVTVSAWHFSTVTWCCVTMLALGYSQKYRYHRDRGRRLMRIYFFGKYIPVLISLQPEHFSDFWQGWHWLPARETT